MKRRDFLKSALIGSIGATVPLSVLAEANHKVGDGVPLFLALHPAGKGEFVWAEPCLSEAALEDCLIDLDKRDGNLIIKPTHITWDSHAR